MKISLNSIRKVNEIYGSAGSPALNGVDELVTKIGAQLGAVEEVIAYGDRFKGVLVARVVSCADHPDADRLHVCKLDDGGAAQNVERDENGHVQVVCGAPNVREGLTVAWLPPGTTVPNTLDTDPFVLEARPLRGVVSNGMLASPRELTVGDSHEGILELDTDAASGTPFAEAYDLVGDVIIDMENKMFTHRPDCFGQLGIARELEGIQGRAYKSPEWYVPNPTFPDVEADELRFEFRNELPELVPRFTAITMRDVTIKPSPIWLQIYLSKLGVRPINNIVDYTNFFMLETGQPLHAYDYDKVMAQDADADHATIVVRKPQQGETITLLNGKTIEPREEAIMIATRDKLIGVGGVMGGGDTEVDDQTRNIILECANFDMYSIRRTAMAHGLFTDAVTRFNKGQSPLQNLAVLAKIVDEIRRYADGKVASAVVDDKHLSEESLRDATAHPAVRVSTQFINERLGFTLSTDEITTLLTNVEFAVEATDDTLTVQAPFWRTDIAIPEDVVEEVGRLYGFDHLPLVLPARDLTPAQKNPLLTLKTHIRQTLSAAGANELLTYSFVHGNLIEKATQDPKQAFQLSNALSPDLQYFRLSLLPSLLEKVHPNMKAGYEQFALFELGKAHNIRELDSEGLPKEVNALSFVCCAEEKTAKQAYGNNAAYYLARTFLDGLMDTCKVARLVAFEPLAGADLYNNPWIEQMTAPFEPSRSAVLRDREGLIWGVVGEFKATVRKSLKLPQFCAGFEIDPLLLMRKSAALTYTRLSRFPKVEQDICLKVPADITYQRVYDFVWQTLQAGHPDQNQPNDAFLAALSPLDIYQRSDDPDHKQITLRCTFVSYERTLTDDEVSKLLDHVAAQAKEQLQAERI